MTTASSVAVGSAHSSHPSPPHVFLSVKALKAEQTENLLSFTFQSQSAVMETYSCVIVICTQHWCQTCCNNEPVTGQWSDLQSALWVCGTRVWLMFLRGRHSVMSSWRDLQSSWITFHCYINITLNLHLNIQAEKFRFTFIHINSQTAADELQLVLMLRYWRVFTSQYEAASADCCCDFVL